jgi:hypothetical protein
MSLPQQSQESSLDKIKNILSDRRVIVFIVLLILIPLVYFIYTFFSKKSPQSTPQSTPSTITPLSTTTPPSSTTPPCVYNDNNWVNVGGCSQECGGGKQGQILQGFPSNCKQIRTVDCNTQSCPPSIPDGIYKEWFNNFQDGTSIIFNRNNSVLYTTCINNIFGCSVNMVALNGSITGKGTEVNQVKVNYTNGASSIYQYNSNNTLTDLSNGIVYSKRW